MYLSHFKPEYSGKPEEDVEAHLSRTNDWMNTHDFTDGVKVQRFYFFLDKARCSLVTENILNFDKLLPVSNLASSRSAVNDD